ncbi:hypothetical protein FOA52_012904 [Chlamydomonas sp. UWO 241]|nr:hypothetical protein FOA52_012904 [Chlamydomonas sp. UWO 241]
MADQEKDEGPSRGMVEQQDQDGGVDGRSQGAPCTSSGGERTGRKRQGSSSRYVGVSWKKVASSWSVVLSDPQAKRQRCIGNFGSEENAARAYDCAVVQARGPGAKRNFPGEVISKLPATVREQRKSSRYIGVSWTKDNSSWHALLRDVHSRRQRHIGSFASEEDAAKAYDHAAVQAHGPGAKRNFPGEVISELPMSLDEERKQRKSSRYIGVNWHKAILAWRVQLWDPQTKRRREVGSYASEEDAARAYDCAAVQAQGPERNLPGEAVGELPVTVGEERRQRNSSRYMGISWHKARSIWHVRLKDSQTKRTLNVGYFASEEDAARAYDCAAVQAQGPGAKRNFPGEAFQNPNV